MERELVDRAARRCAFGIQARLGLFEPPETVLFDRREGDAPEPEPVLDLPEARGKPNGPHRALAENYLQLSHDLDGEQRVESIFVEVRVRLGQVLVCAGHSRLAAGRLATGERFAAVVAVEVGELFRECGVRSLLSLGEIEAAEKSGLDFLQIYVRAGNPAFMAAVVPSLRNGFVLFRGNARGGEQYEEAGYVHLRKYLDGTPREAAVLLEHGGGGAEFSSPSENGRIVEYLSSLKRLKYPGKAVKRIGSPVVAGRGGEEEAS